jgi:hypothetical protein
MDSDVFLQVLGKSEPLVTVVTSEWAFIGVNHLMSVEIFE